MARNPRLFSNTATTLISRSTFVSRCRAPKLYIIAKKFATMRLCPPLKPWWRFPCRRRGWSPRLSRCSPSPYRLCSAFRHRAVYHFSPAFRGFFRVPTGSRPLFADALRNRYPPTQLGGRPRQLTM